MLQRLRFIPLRIVQAIPVVFGVTLVVFFLVRFLPGSPAIAMLGEHATPAAIAAVDKEYGLNAPIWVQYGDFIGNLVRGNLGQSLFYHQPVSQLVRVGFPATLYLVVYAIVLTVIISVPLAAVAASAPGRARDQFVRVGPLVGLGMPQFWVGIMLILILGVRLKIFPIGGYGSDFVANLGYLFLPALTVAISMSPIVIRSLRSAMISVLGSDYVGTARSKGTSPFHLFSRHVLRNAAVPTVTVLGVNVGYLLGGTIVVEKVFALPGLGNYMVTAIFNRDFPTVQGITLVIALMVVVVGILTDVVYALLDPRVKLA
ncbi:ABC transporter permease [Gryllotalpicola reticulitermitis]|uniref:ABC transporter permease n=1 Tax=Gryllotalpicola reticulitermitis TaxID=1184153 RepID=A0ABV8Q1S9_9MICO